jgi:hypothetical protein
LSSETILVKRATDDERAEPQERTKYVEPGRISADLNQGVTHMGKPPDDEPTTDTPTPDPAPQPDVEPPAAPVTEPV